MLVQSKNGAMLATRVSETVIPWSLDLRTPARPQRRGPYARATGRAVRGRPVGARHVQDPRRQRRDKVGPALDTVAKLDKQEHRIPGRGVRRRERGQGADEAFEDDFQKAEVTSLPITLIILVLAFGALLAAFVPLLLAITAVAATIGLLGPISQIIPDGGDDQLGRAADRPGRRRRLLAVLPPP